MTKRKLKKLQRKVGTVKALNICRKVREKKALYIIALTDSREKHGMEGI